ncbi:MAG: hypothetical protein J5I93_26855 [Pirellulaceae bacterium]|nr:hypothetical protein [Pirellulaceae bacterium]
MLVILSDLHLTDGTHLDTVPLDAWLWLSEQLRQLAVRASWRADDTYRPIERVDLVLLGDVLDLLNSATWLDGAARPWDDRGTGDWSRTLERIAADVLRHNESGLGLLRQLAHDGGMTVPASGESSRASDEVRVPVDVQVHYMVGDHDWPLHVEGPELRGARQRVRQAFGATRAGDEPFPHEPADCADLLTALRRHRVLARHGDRFCPLSFAGQRGQSAASDAILIQLGVRFARDAERQLAADLPVSMRAGLRELSLVRPLVLQPLWLEAEMYRCEVRPAVRDWLNRRWDELTAELLELPPLREAGRTSGPRLLDGLAAAMRCVGHGSSHRARNSLEWFRQLRGSADDSLACHAMEEQDFRNRRARHVVYGHTHQAESVPLDASCADGFVLNQIYFNAGTWRPAYRPAGGMATRTDFVVCDQLQLLVFYQGDERGGRPFETWSHWLARRPARNHQLRLDPPPAVSQVVPGSTAALPSAPHFRLPLPIAPSSSSTT